MKADLKIKTIQNNQGLPTVQSKCEYNEIGIECYITYLELEYANNININKETGIVVVEKRGTGNNKYYSKLIFEFQKKHKCSINTGEYTLFVDINTIKVDICNTGSKLSVDLQYYINDSFNEVNIEVN